MIQKTFNVCIPFFIFSFQQICETFKIKTRQVRSTLLTIQNNNNNESRNELSKQEMDLVGIDSRRLVIL